MPTFASDTNRLTGADMMIWADVWWGAGHRETTQWQFIDTELDAPDLKTTCFGKMAAAEPANAGPAAGCGVNKICEFADELRLAENRSVSLVHAIYRSRDRRSG